jgi:hypothetical protein
MRWQNCHLKRKVHHCMQWRTPIPRGWLARRWAAALAGPGCTAGGQPLPPEGGLQVPAGTPPQPAPGCPGAGLAWAGGLGWLGLRIFFLL